MSFSSRSVLVLGVFAFFSLFLAGCVIPPAPVNQSSICGDNIVTGNEQCDGTVPCKDASLKCGPDCKCRPPEKKNVTCADNSFKVGNGSANTFNSSTMLCKDDCARISPNAVCDPTVCLCRTETRTCVKNSVEVSANAGKNTFNAGLMVCRDDCADLDPTFVCDAVSCTCKKKENETFYCVNNTKEVALTHTNEFNKDTMLCRDDCAALLGPNYRCNGQNCTCYPVSKTDLNCGANTIIAPIFGNIFNPATMICKDDCVASFGAGWKCDGVTCTCSKKPPEKESCAWNSFAIAFGAPNTFDPAKVKCEDDCKDIGPEWVCDAKFCTCQKQKLILSCAWNAVEISFGGKNIYDPAKMICKDDCANWLDSTWYCDGASCECKKKPTENQTQNCAANTLTVNYPKGPVAPETQCKDDCKELGSTYVCDPEGCFCKETRTVTPRCGDGYVSGPNVPGGGFEECDVGFGFYQPKDANGTPYHTPDTCPPPTVCDAPTCKCVQPVTEGYCGDGVISGGEQCDWASASTNKCSEGSYCSECECKKLETQPRCGDGKISVEAGEQCDGGNVQTNICQSGYKCYTPECICVPLEGSSQCGDGTVVPPEECDHGNSYTAQCPDNKYCVSCECSDAPPTQSHTECDYSHGQCVVVEGAGTNECSSDADCEEEIEEPYCGNGQKDVGEECDGNDDSACSSDEYCSSNCQCVQSVTTPQYHMECDFGHGACIQVEGSGQNECSSDSQCQPPVIDCPAYCEGQGYSQSLGGGYSSASACQAAAAESAQTCTTKCVYSKFYSASNQAGTTTCCCKDVKVFACSDCPGQNPECPDPDVICPDNQP